jgi:hypothetical protein
VSDRASKVLLARRAYVSGTWSFETRDVRLVRCLDYMATTPTPDLSREYLSGAFSIDDTELDFVRAAYTLMHTERR